MPFPRAEIVTPRLAALATRLRPFARGLIATHLPLLSYIVWGTATGRIALAECGLLWLAALVGAAVLNAGNVRAVIDAMAGASSTSLPPIADKAPSDLRWLEALEAQEDRLTGIANRCGFLSQVEALSDAKQRGCVALIEIDHFRQLEDQLGHPETQRILADFAARLSSQTRRVDIVARWDAWHFAIFYQDAIEDEASWSLARIADRMRQEPVAAVHGEPVTFSAGLCGWRDGPVTDAVEKAEEALREARRSGRDQIRRAVRGNPMGWPGAFPSALPHG